MPPTPAQPDPTVLMRQAVREIRELKGRVRDLEQNRFEPIAVLGMACRFPGGVQSPGELWDLLAAGRDAITEVPADRWRIEDYHDPRPGTPGKIVSRCGGFIKDAGGFDAEFFGITPREAEAMDPQQRHLLEVVWEALENSALPVSGLRGHAASVFVGVMGSDYAQYSSNPEDLDLHTGTGAALSILAGRIGHFFDFRGPAMTIDTACSSSLVAIHLACQSLRLRESELAVAAGVNLMLSPLPSVAESVAQMLSPDGRCRTFDAAASGIVRGEGIGVVILKRLQDALRDGDEISAVVMGSAVNHDGHSSGLTVPNELAQEAVLSAAWSSAGLDPSAAGYIEAHGTGTVLGDPIEAGALARVLCRDRGMDRPLWMGSVKTNLGHLEGAAGMAGFIKTVLTVQAGLIPPSLHFKKPNPHIPWDQVPLRVPVKLEPWPDRAGAGARAAGVSSFGLSGTNAHLVITQAPERPAAPKQSSITGESLEISARTESALRQLANSHVQLLRSRGPDCLGMVCELVRRGRCSFEKRMVAAGDYSAILDQLERFAADSSISAVSATQAAGAESWPVEKGMKILLPNYPWHHRRYWLDRPVPGSERRTGRRLRPLLERRVLNAGEAAGSWRFESRLRSDCPAYLGDHKVFGAVIFPGACFLEMACEAAREVSGPGTLELLDVEWNQPLRLDNSKVVQLFLNHEGHDTGRFRFRIFSRQDDSNTVDWLEHASGLIVRPTGETSDGLENFRSAAKDSPVDVEDYYSTLRQHGIEYGPAFRVIHRLARGEESSSAGLQSALGPGMDFELDPTLLDGLFQCLGAALPVRADADVYLPVGVGRMRLYRSCGRNLKSVIQLRRGTDCTLPVLTLDAWMLNSCDEPVLELNGLKVQRATGKTLLRGTGGHRDRTGKNLFRLDWEPVSSPVPDEGTIASPSCLVFSPTSGIGSRLSEALARSGCRVHVAIPGTVYRRLSSNQTEINPLESEHFRQLLNEQSCEQLLFCWGAGNDESTGLQEHDSAADEMFAGFLHLVQSGIANVRRREISILLLTHRAFQHEGLTINPLETALWGLARTAALEHPELRIRSVELDEEFLNGDVRTKLFSNPGENQLIWRGGQCLAARLQPVEEPAVQSRLNFAPDRSCLVTGAFGAIGRQVVKRLQERGVRKLVLLGRNPPDAGDPWLAQVRQNADALLIDAVDVGDEQAMQQVFARVASEQGELAGIIHAAGTLEDGVVSQMEWTRFQKPFRAKIRGAWILDRLSQNMDLDFFVLFSSSTALLGSPGQANYAAANGYLDGLAARRRASGRRAMSVQWGIWSGEGMGQKSAERPVKGLGSLDAIQALDTMESLIEMNPDSGVISVMAMDWKALASSSPDVVRQPFFRRVVSATLEVPRFRKKLAELPVADRFDALQQFVQHELGQVMRMDPSRIEPRTRLFDVGMDSLIAVEFKNRLQAALDCNMPTTLVFDYPTLGQLCSFLAVNIPGLEVPEKQEKLEPAPIGPSGGSGAVDEFDALSDDELAQLLAQRLQAGD